MIIVICELGHKTEYNLLGWPRSFPRTNWRCKKDIEGKPCGRSLLNTDSVIITPIINPPPK